MSTYRVYVLDTTKPLEPITHVAYVSEDKYDGAWKSARAILSGSKPGEVQAKTGHKVSGLFGDDSLKTPINFKVGDHTTVAAIMDIKPRNTKLDKVKIQEMLADKATSDADKVKLLAQLIGSK